MKSQSAIEELIVKAQQSEVLANAVYTALAARYVYGSAINTMELVAGVLVIDIDRILDNHTTNRLA